MKSNPASSHTKKKASASAKQELWPLMFEMARIMKREVLKECKDGVVLPTYLHIETLRYIEERKNPTMREIADYLKIAPPSATSLINALAKENVITRSADPEDRRIVRLMISKKGQRLLEDIARKREDAFTRVLEPLSAADRKEYARILKIIISHSN